MSVQISKLNKFIKIDCQNTNYEELFEILEQYDKSFIDQIYQEILYYDRTKDTEIPNKVIYCLHSNGSYYSIHPNENKLFVNKRTIYDENNPCPSETSFAQSDDDISEFDKKFHIDDKTILIDKTENYYTIVHLKHGLFHKSTFFGKAYNSQVKDFKRMLSNKKYLLKIAQKLIEDIKKIDNIETILDINTFEIIPNPDNFTFTKKQS